MLPVLPHIMRHLRALKEILKMRELSKEFKDSLRTLRLDVDARNHDVELDHLLKILSGVEKLRVRTLRVGDERLSHPLLSRFQVKYYVYEFRGCLSQLFPHMKELVGGACPEPSETFPHVEKVHLRATEHDRLAVSRIGEMFPEIRSLYLNGINHLTLHREEMDSLVLVQTLTHVENVSVKIKRCRVLGLSGLSPRRFVNGFIEVENVDTLFLDHDPIDISLPQVRHLVLGQTYGNGTTLQNIFETVSLLYYTYSPLTVQSENIIIKDPFLRVEGNMILKRIVLSTRHGNLSIDIKSDRPALLIIDAVVNDGCEINLEGIHTVIFTKRVSRKTLEKLGTIPYKNVPEEDEDLKWWKSHIPFNRNSIHL